MSIISVLKILVTIIIGILLSDQWPGDQGTMSRSLMGSRRGSLRWPQPLTSWSWHKWESQNVLLNWIFKNSEWFISVQNVGFWRNICNTDILLSDLMSLCCELMMWWACIAGTGAPPSGRRGRSPPLLDSTAATTPRPASCSCRPTTNGSPRSGSTDVRRLLMPRGRCVTRPCSIGDEETNRKWPQETSSLLVAM